MEDYRLEQSGQEVQDILNGAAMQTDLTAENKRAELAEQTLQGNIDAEALARENADGVLQGHIDAEEIRAKAAEKQNADDIDAIEEKIPTQASSSNQLADKDYVEDLVSTSSATFRGTFNLVSDLHLTVDASYADIAAALGNAIAGADNNDFAFVMIPTSVDTPNEIARIEKYKFNGSVWGFEYMLNNSGFTAAQWAAINSGITSALVTKLGALPSAADLAAALLAKQDKLTFDQAPTPSSTNPVTSGGVYTAIDDEKGARVNADAALQQAIEAILLLIPSAATALNQLADKAFVNSSIATATATFRGTFNLVSDLQLTVEATHTDIAAALLNAISTADNNDYVFVQIPTSVDTPTEIRVTERYKFNGTAWQYEYDLNNSGFTAAQWEAINSGITALLVTKLSNLPNATELATLFAGKQNVLTFDNAPVQNSDNPVKSGGLYDLFAAIDAKMPTGASANNKLVAEDRLAAYVGGIIGALDATFDLTSTDGHVTLRMTQTDGVITSLQILTYDIASASALATLGGQVSTNADDIAALQDAYAALTQSDVVVGALPSSGQQQNIIYRQPDQDHTPPQFYSDYMWNGSTWVLMATYNNAIDPRPKKASQNLVTSGGVFDNMGALDVSELNATENPHTLAQYIDLSAALAAVPTDYQKGGMSIKFVQSSDNNYVQYRLTKEIFSISVNDWQSTSDVRYINGKIYSISQNNGFNLGSFKVGDIIKIKVRFFNIIEGMTKRVALFTTDTWATTISPSIQIANEGIWYQYEFENDYPNVYLQVFQGSAEVELLWGNSVIFEDLNNLKNRTSFVRTINSTSGVFDNLGSFKTGDTIYLKRISSTNPNAYVALLQTNSWTTNLVPTCSLHTDGDSIYYTFQNDYDNVYLGFNGTYGDQAEVLVIRDIRERLNTNPYLNVAYESIEVGNSEVIFNNVDLTVKNGNKKNITSLSIPINKFTIVGPTVTGLDKLILSSTPNTYTPFAAKLLMDATTQPYILNVSAINDVDIDDILYQQCSSIGILSPIITDFLSGKELPIQYDITAYAAVHGVRIGSFSTGDAVRVKVESFNDVPVGSRSIVALMPNNGWDTHLSPAFSIEDTTGVWYTYIFENNYEDVYLNIFSGNAVVDFARVSHIANSKWAGKKVGFLGDSITDFGQYVNAYSAMTGCVAVNYGIGGTTIAGDYANAFCKRYTQMANDLDMLVVFGGINDFRGSGHSFPLGVFNNANLDGSLDTTFYGALHTLMRGLRAKYNSNIPIVFLTPLHCQYSADGIQEGDYDLTAYNTDGTLIESTYPLNTGSGNGAPLSGFIEAIKKTAEFYSIKVIDTYAISGIQPILPENKTAYTQDGLHLNYAGGELLASVIQPLLELL